MSQLFGRIGHAARVGLWAYRSYDMAPGALDSAWDDYTSAMRRYELYAAYYDNSVYQQIKYKLRWYRTNEQLYRFTRGLRNPVTRCVDLYPALIAGGEIDYERLSTGAVQVLGADDKLIGAIIQGLKWSNWGTEKSTYIRQAALLGDTVLMVVDDPVKRKAWLEPVDPRKVAYFETDSMGNVTYIEFEYEREERIGVNQMRRYTYRLVITDKKFYTFKNGEPFAFYEDSFGQKVSEWDNVYGFVPVVFAPLKRIGDHRRGVNCFHHSLGKIDEVNDAASALHDYMRRSYNPPWLLAGAKRKEDIDARRPARDQETFLYAPEGTVAQSLVHITDVGSGLSNLEQDMQELRDDMPELALADLRQGVNVTQPGVEAGWSDAEARITEAAGNLNDGFIRAMQMLITIAAMGNYDPAFSGYNINSFDRGDLSFYVKAPKIIQDKLSLDQQITFWLQIGNKTKAMELLGATEQEIAEFEQEEQAMLDQFSANIEAEAASGENAQLPANVEGQNSDAE